MSSLKHSVKTLQRKNSKTYVFVLTLVLVIFTLGALFIRYNYFELLRMGDSSMYPKLNEKSLLWVCKLPQCLEDIKFNDIVWAEEKNKETVVRKVIAVPGQKIKINDNKRIFIEKKRLKLKEENIFIETRDIYIPKKGDTLFFANLNDVEEDFAVNIMMEQKIDFFVKTSLWQGEKEQSLELIGPSKLANRQVSLQELDMLPWQDRLLLTMQIFQREAGVTPYAFKREFFNAKDSSKIEYVVAKDDYFFLLSENTSHYQDSRELGYFPKQKILGRFVASPEKVYKQVIQYFEKTKSKGQRPSQQ